MNQTVTTRGSFMDFMYICRAIFHVEAANGTGLSIFSNFIVEK